LQVGRDPSELLTYQPLRYEVEFAGRLTVVGVEDPELYGADVARFEEWRAAGRRLLRERLDDPERRELVLAQRRLLEGIRRNAEARGRSAAIRLLRRMEAAGARRAALLIGGAHADGATAELLAHGVSVVVFEAASYRVPEERR
jgi:hypothetical protein